MRSPSIRVRLNPAIGQPDSGNLTGDCLSPIEALGLAQLRFVRCLVGYGASPDVVDAVVLAELSRFRKAEAKKRRRRFELVGDHLVSASV
jgi:hypothetical protein